MIKIKGNITEETGNIKAKSPNDIQRKKILEDYTIEELNEMPPQVVMELFAESALQDFTDDENDI
ncbi:MAG: hypothetical protein NTZ33_04785 [Bacteroidetes bacterium]|nr:hypothetical protein [Bacteroidota bacterium]